MLKNLLTAFLMGFALFGQGCATNKPINTGEAPMKTSQRLIIKFKKDVPEEKRREIINNYELRLIKTIPELNMYVVEVQGRASQEELIKELSKVKEVEYVEPDRIYRTW
ncbi:MAG: S8 family serine peptidase [Aquificaceae bacterium]